MRISEALTRIDEIHTYLTRAEVYRGFRSWPVAFSGLAGLAASLAFAVLGQPVGSSLVWAWWMVALGCAGISGSEIAYHYCWTDDRFARAKTRRVLGQFAPCLVAGAVASFGIAHGVPRSIGLLPGLWCLFFGLGLFAARPHLPRSIGWVALYYLAVGGWLTLAAESGESFSPWRVGIPFGAGQLASALVLYWNLERRPDDV